jgi:hypothetical protein
MSPGFVLGWLVGHSDSESETQNLSTEYPRNNKKPAEFNFEETVMKKSLLLVLSICGACFLSACGGGSTTPALVANHLSVVAATSTPTAGTAFNVTVTAMDSSNKVVTSYTGPVRLSSSDGNAALPASGTLLNGTGSFSVTLKTASSETITATDAANTALTGASGTLNVNAGMATRFSLSGRNSALLGAAYSVTVDALDTFGNVATAYAGTVHFTSSDAQAVLPVNSSLTNGAGTFSVTLKTAPSETITATDTVTASITGTSILIIVSTAAAPVISTSPSPTVGAANVTYYFAFTVASGGQPPFDWSETGALPPGLTFNNATGELMGTPTIPATSSFPITLQVQDSLGQDSAPQAFTIQIGLHGFSITGSLGTEREGHTATVLSTGKVLVTGGSGIGAQVLSSDETFDLLSGKFTTGKGMGTPRELHTATLLKSGQVLVAGGMQSNSQALASAELFDPTTGMFTPTKGNMVDARWAHTATLLNDGKVLLTGGVGSSGDSITTSEIFDPTAGTFAPTTGNMQAARAGHTATLLSSGKVLVTGGRNNAGDFATAEVFDPTKGSFALTTGSMETARTNQTATLLGDGTVLVAGGFAGVIALATAEVFDPGTEIFTSTAGSMANARGDHTATLLNDRTVLIAGGAEYLQKFNGKPVPTSLGSAELYDPASKTFSTTGGLAGGLGFNGSRFFHTASLLTDGRVLVTGGVQQSVVRGQISSTVLATAELYK